MKRYMENEDENYLQRYRSLSKGNKIRTMAYHIIDHLVLEYSYLEYEDFPSPNDEKVIDLKALIKMLEEMHHCC
jgi:hypothetical protein